MDADCFDGIVCTVDRCDTAQTPPRCVYDPDNVSCDDGEFCNGTETCDPAADCQPGQAPLLDDGNECTADYCDEAGDTIVHDPQPHIGDLCMSDAGTCQEDGFCLIACESDEQCVDGIDCTLDWCDVSQAPYACAHDADHESCDDGSFCNGEEFCDYELGCQSGPDPELDDGNECTEDYCDEDQDMVIHDPEPRNGMACQNGTGICENGVCVGQGEIVVGFDIKPGSCPNPMNVKSKGVLPVAILGNVEFDVTTIDVGSIRLGREGIEQSVAPVRSGYEDVATPFEGDPCDCHDLGGDGYLDLTLKFRRSDIVNTLELKEFAGSTIPLVITGNLEDGEGNQIIGEDCVRLIEN